VHFRLFISTFILSERGCGKWNKKNESSRRRRTKPAYRDSRNIQFAEKAEVSLFVRHVCARPSRHFGPVQTPSAVARASSAVDSSSCQSAHGFASRAQKRERDRRSDRSARERTKRTRRRVAGYLIPSLWVTKARNPPLVLPPLVLLEVLWTAADGSGSQRTNNIVYFSDGSHRRNALQFAPRGWECMIHDVGDTRPYFDPSFHSSLFIPSSSVSCDFVSPIDFVRSWTLCTIHPFLIPFSSPLPCLRWRECRFQ